MDGIAAVLDGWLSGLPSAGPFLLVALPLLTIVAGGFFLLRGTRFVSGLAAGLDRALTGIVATVLLAMVFLSGLQILLRNVFASGLGWIDPLLRHLVLLLAFVGAILATGAKRHVQINVLGRLLHGVPARVSGALIGGLAGTVSLLLAYASLELLRDEVRVRRDRVPLRAVVGRRRHLPDRVPRDGLPVPAPRLRGSRRASLPRARGGDRGRRGVERAPRGRAVTSSSSSWFVAALFGLPLFLVLASVALALFSGDDIRGSAVVIEMLRLASSPMLVAIPLFTFAGSIFAEGGAARAARGAVARAVRLDARRALDRRPGHLRALHGVHGRERRDDRRGGGAAAAGAREGGLPAALLARARDDFGLARPALPAEPAADHLRVRRRRGGGRARSWPASCPGSCSWSCSSLWGARRGRHGRRGHARVPAAPRPAAAVREAIWEIPLPFVVLGGIYSGAVTVTEAASLTAIYALVVEVCIYRDVPIRRRPGGSSAASMVLVGRDPRHPRPSAFGLTNYLIDAEVPMEILEWMQGAFSSKWTFLLALNVLPAGRRQPDGHLLGADRGGAADRPDRRGIRRESRPPGDHLPDEPRDRLLDAAGRAEPVHLLVPVQAPDRGALPGQHPVPASSCSSRWRSSPIFRR